ncbi:hypothetical protein SK128_013112, partial [Halocaridina rubra]
MHVPLTSRQWNFFLLGYLKDEVHATKPRTVDEFKEEIGRQYLAITNEMIHNIVKSNGQLYQLCLENDGNQFEHLRLHRNELTG